MPSEKPPREYSKDPKRIRQRLRRRAAISTYGQPQKTRNDLAMLYGKPIEDWDFEELQMGRPRKPNGKFGKRKSYADPVIIAETNRRLKEMAAQELAVHTGEAIRCIANLVNTAEKETVRLDAAKFVVNHVIGLPTAKIEHSGEVSLKAFLADCIVNDDGDLAHPLIEPGVIDGEVVEDDDDGDDSDD